MIVASRAGWIGKINSNSTTISNQANFEIVGSDSVGVRDYECSLDSGKWNRIDHLDVEKNVCQYSQLPDGTHIFESRAIDKYGNVDNSPSTFNWTVTSIDEGIQEIINLISANLTETETKNFDLPLVESQKLLTNTDDYSKLTICYNMDTFLNEINDLSLHDKLDKPHINQLVISTLSIKDRLTCV
ncbi:MAG TPA: hypothetical protein VH415_00225 [Nitrososphaeraceae archaeon]|jgi:hypothetical protein